MSLKFSSLLYYRPYTERVFFFFFINICKIDTEPTVRALCFKLGTQ